MSRIVGHSSESSVPYDEAFVPNNPVYARIHRDIRSRNHENAAARIKLSNLSSKMKGKKNRNFTRKIEMDSRDKCLRNANVI